MNKVKYKLKRSIQMKYEWRKREKSLYMTTGIQMLKIPKMKFITIAGEGNPNTAQFTHQIEALYGLSYAIRMKYKTGYYEDPFIYTVYPLEGVWTSKEKPIDGVVDKEGLVYQIMIRQPDTFNAERFDEIVEETYAKKNNPFIKVAQLIEYEEGHVIQGLHIGSFDTEKETFDQMEQLLATNNMKKTVIMEKYQHREIYLSDARRVLPEKQKTLLRYKIIE